MLKKNYGKALNSYFYKFIKSSMRKFIIFITLLYFNTLSAQIYTDTYIKDANKIALEWWHQVNTGQYEQSYIKLSGLLKSRFPLANYSTNMSMLIDEIGDIQSRIVKETFFQSKLEGFEDGFYVTVLYDVEYSKTRNHTETLLLKQNSQMNWEIFDFSYTFQPLEVDK